MLVSSKLSAEIEDRELFEVAGLMGGGKAILLKLIAGLIKSDTGEDLFVPACEDRRLRGRANLRGDPSIFIGKRCNSPSQDEPFTRCGVSLGCFRR